MSSPHAGPRAVPRVFSGDGDAAAGCSGQGSRWETEFGRWVSDFGVSRIVIELARDPDLRVTNQAVCQHGRKVSTPHDVP